MAARDILAAAILVLGIAAISTGAFLISAPAGFVVLGVLLSAFGLAIGFGERDELVHPAAAEEVETGSPAAGNPPADTTPASATPAVPAADLAAISSVPLAKYLGRTGHPDPVAVPGPSRVSSS